MATASQSRTNTDSIRTNRTYIDTLIQNASNEGRELIVVDHGVIDSTMVNSLKSDGYSVTIKQDSMGTYKEYKISW